MAGPVTFKTNVDQVIKSMGGFLKDVPEKAVVRALNTTARDTDTELNRAIRDQGYKLKARVVRQRIKIVQASPGRLTAHVVATGRPVPLIEYNARPTNAGVTVEVLKGRKLIPHAFIATMPNGVRMVCLRDGGGKHKKVKRHGKWVWEGLPIEVLYGPSVADAANNQGVADRVMSFAEDAFEKNLRHEIDRIHGS